MELNKIFLNEIDRIIQKIPVSTAVAEEKANTEFKTKFNKLSTLIDPIVVTVNDKLNNKGYSLDVIRSNNSMDDSSRVFVQIVLKEGNKKINLLRNPYLLIEGYPKTGNVQIGGTASTATELNIEMVNPEIIESSFFLNFYQKLF